MQAFIQAWNAACHSKGAAKVVIPAAAGSYLSGEVLFTGPCSCAKPLTVEVQGNLLAETDLSEYPNGQWFTVQNVDGLQITGGGTFDGQGQTAWQYNSCGHQAICESPLPPSMVFDGVNNSAIQGINLVNSKGTHLKIRGSHNITFQNLNITAAAGSPTEGIHIAQSDLVTISSSAIKASEGCISKGDGVRDIAISALHCL
ncbi:galacturonan 1,4-alpha-galacturonidase [Sarracenia purpurea var. burkii]